MTRTLVRWLPWAFLATILCGLIYAAVQQNYRQSANDPQVQMAEDAAIFLKSGVAPNQVVPLRKSNIRQSLWPFMTVTDTVGQVLASSVEEEHPPVPPQSSLEAADRAGMNRITWEPEKGIRHATVIVPYTVGTGTSTVGYVVAGRSLREVEKREAQLIANVLLAWLAAMLGTFILARAQERFARRDA
jgi:hypothetical protein